MESRIETLLKALLNGDTIEDFVPQSRSEAYLKNCILRNGVAGLPAPQSRMDALLYQLAEEIPGWSGGSDLLYAEEVKF